MGELNLPDTLGSQLDDIQRRLRALEAGQRVGLNRIRLAWSTVDAAPTVYGAYQFGPAAAQWADDRGNTGTGYPRVVLQAGTRALMFAQAYCTNLALDATFRSSQFTLSIGASGQSAAADPVVYRFQSHGPTTEGNQPLFLMGARSDMTPLQASTFAVACLLENRVPAAPNLPVPSSIVLAIVPID